MSPERPYSIKVSCKIHQLQLSSCSCCRNEAPARPASGLCQKGKDSTRMACWRVHRQRSGWAVSAIGSADGQGPKCSSASCTCQPNCMRRACACSCACPESQITAGSTPQQAELPASHCWCLVLACVSHDGCTAPAAGGGSAGGEQRGVAQLRDTPGFTAIARRLVSMGDAAAVLQRMLHWGDAGSPEQPLAAIGQAEPGGAEHGQSSSMSASGTSGTCLSSSGSKGSSQLEGSERLLVSNSASQHASSSPGCSDSLPELSPSAASTGGLQTQAQLIACKAVDSCCCEQAHQQDCTDKPGEACHCMLMLLMAGARPEPQTGA